MGKLLPNYRQSIVEDIVSSIDSNNSFYYAYASNPVPSVAVANVTGDDLSSAFQSNWQMLFGKKITNNDILPVITNITWTTNTVYARYDNTKDMSNSNFFVVVDPAAPGGNYNIYKCIDNAGNTASIIKPDLVQSTSFEKSDGYIWRYITSISNADWEKFSTTAYAPVYSNTSIVATAALNSGVEVVVIANGGVGYATYNEGTISSLLNSSTLQISNTASADNNFYQNNAIYIYNTNSPTAEVRTITSYVANSIGKWVNLDQAANTNNIIPGVTLYKISPKVVFETDGSLDPIAYTTINAVSNSIHSVVIVETGSDISWANVSIQSNTVYGAGANVYAIVPPPGGHGSNPGAELHVKGFSVSASFINNEYSTIADNVQYNKIGLLKNPTMIDPLTGDKDPTSYTSNTFSSLLEANVATAVVFTVGEEVVGANSGARGTVAFSNSTIVYLTGDKTFSNNEYITSSNTNQTAQIVINTLGDIYTKDIKPIYVQNITDVSRSSSQTETFKLIVQI